MAGQPPGSYPPGWIFPLFVVDAVVAGLALVTYIAVSPRLPVS